MRKSYTFTILALAFLYHVAGTAQTQIVKDYHPPRLEYGLSPTNIVSNTDFMVFSGTADASVHPLFGTTPYPEPFACDGTADNFIAYDINPGYQNNYLVGSNPKHFFVLNNEIYFTATSDTSTALYKINDLSGTVHFVTSRWVPTFQPQVITSGSPETEKVLMVGKDPTNNADDNFYLLEWNGLDPMPKLKDDQKNISGEALYEMDGSKGFLYVDGLTETLVFAATDPNNDTGTEFCVYYNDEENGARVFFTDLFPGVKEVNGIEYQNNGSPEDFTMIDGVVYFNSSYTNEVWKLDIANGDTTAVLVDSINNAIHQNTTLKLLTEWNGKLVFGGVAKTSENDTEPQNVFTYNPLTQEVVPMITSGDFQIRDVQYPAILNDTLYFAGHSRSIPYDNTKSAAPLWRYDGAELVNITPHLDAVSNLHVFKDELYFSANDWVGVDNGDGTFSPTYAELFVYKPIEVEDTSGTDTTTTAVRKISMSALNIWPNPSTGTLNISGIGAENGFYSLCDLSGKCVEKGRVINSQIRSNIPEGMYILQIDTQKQSYVAKVIIQ